MTDLYKLAGKADLYEVAGHKEKPEKTDLYELAGEANPWVDMAKQAVVGAGKGVLQAGQALTDFWVTNPAKFLESLWPIGGITYSGEYVPNAMEMMEQTSLNPLIESLPKPETLPGQLVGGIAQFAAPTGLYAKGLKEATALVPATRTALSGLLGDTTAFAPDQQGLAQLVEQTPLANPLTGTLVKDPNDPDYVNMAKSGLEGMLAAKTVEKAIHAGSGLFKKPSPKPISSKPTSPKPVKAPDILPEESRIVLDTDINRAKQKATPFQENLKVAPAADDFAANLNLEKLDTDTSVKEALKKIAGRKDDFVKQRRGIRSHEATKKSAEVQDLENLLGRPVGVAYNAEEALKLRQTVVDSGELLLDLARKAEGGSDKDLLAFQKHLVRHVAIQEQLAGATAEAGRALNQFRITVKGQKAKQQMIKDIIESSGGRNKIEATARALTQVPNDKALNEFAEKAYRPTIGDMTIEAWINSLLSGPQTHVVNSISNTLTNLWTLPENLVAAGIGKLHKGDKVYFKDVASRAVGMGPGLRKGISNGLKALRTEEPLDALSKVESAKYKAIPGVAGKVIRIPGRALMAEDEFFKAIGKEMELHSLATRKAIDGGYTGEALAKKTAEYLEHPTEEMLQSAIKSARYVTFTKPLGPMGKNVQGFFNSHPALKFIAPFIRTPTNIVKFAGERTPFSLASKKVRDVLRGKEGKAARDLQVARLGIGTALSAMVFQWAQDGTITGGGAVKPEEKSVQYLNKRQPYSILVGDKYYAYGRFEPLGMLLGTAADAAEIAKNTGKKDAEEIGAMVLASVTKNLTSKTWLKGISDLVEMVNDPTRYGEHYIQNFLGTAIPTGVGQLARAEDPILRQTNSVIEKLKSRVPGMSKELLPRLNLWGEPIKFEGSAPVGVPGADLLSPVYVSTKGKDKASQELERLEFFPKIPNKKIGTVELTPEQYNEFASSAGKMTKKAMDKFVHSAGYERVPDQIKKDIMQKIFIDQRKVARSKFLAENKEILKQDAKNKIESYR